MYILIHVPGLANITIWTIKLLNLPQNIVTVNFGKQCQDCLTKIFHVLFLVYETLQFFQRQFATVGIEDVNSLTLLVLQLQDLFFYGIFTHKP